MTAPPKKGENDHKVLLIDWTNTCSLESEEKQESHHKTEQSHGLRQRKSQDGIWEELLLQWGVPGITNNEWTEYGANTSTCRQVKEILSTGSSQHSAVQQEGHSPEPATPTVAAPAPMNLAAESISLETAEVWKFLTKGTWKHKKHW